MALQQQLYIQKMAKSNLRSHELENHFLHPKTVP